MRLYGILACFLICSVGAFAQEPIGNQRSFVEAIEDNSFLIEEAYNQEARVVQHISTLMYFRNSSSDLLYTFTQEWPLFSQTHQLSATIPYSWLHNNAVNGVGDIILNYRYQFLDGSDWVAVAPRMSVILPTGNPKKGLGNDAFGFQFNLPMSKRLTDQFVIHANAGATFFPSQVPLGPLPKEGTLTSYNFGASVIYLATSNLNFILEWIYNLTGDFDGGGNVVHTGESILNPGVRAAINVGELQIVPGLAVPVSFSGGTQRVGMFFYLSFEHPF